MNKTDIIDILKKDSSQELFAQANQTKEKTFGKTVILRAVIAFSNFCTGHCQYCGIHANNKRLERYRFSPEHIEQYAKEAYDAGYRSIVLQSGEDPQYDADKMSETIERIKKLGDILIMLSVGERSKEEYKQWKDSGADWYLLKHETADETLYNSLHRHSTFRKRLECLHTLKELGYQVGSGFITGLPGQTVSSIADDLLLLQELELDMAGIGAYIPHPATQIYNSTDKPPDAAELAIRAVAAARLMLPHAQLPAAASIEAAGAGSGRSVYRPLETGANVVMKKAEPFRYRKLYEVYPNPYIADKPVKQEREELVQTLEQMGLTVETKVR